MFFHKSPLKRLIFSIPVIFVIILTSFVFYCYHAGYMWIGEGSLLKDSIVYGLVFLLSWAYFACMLADARTTPDNYKEQPGTKEYEATFCKYCDNVRPPRTHHCRSCDRCILRHDHHCPWVGNCVGFGNHRYFIQFVVYATIDTGIVGSCCFGVVLRNDDLNWFTILGAVLGLGLSVVIGSLAGFHVWGMLANRTTIEFKKSQEYNIFDMVDWRNNIKQVFGDNLLAYVLPITTSGNLSGLEYPYNLENLVEDITDDSIDNLEVKT